MQLLRYLYQQEDDRGKVLLSGSCGSKATTVAFDEFMEVDQQNSDYVFEKIFTCACECVCLTI